MVTLADILWAQFASGKSFCSRTFIFMFPEEAKFTFLSVSCQWTLSKSSLLYHCNLVKTPCQKHKTSTLRHCRVRCCLSLVGVEILCSQAVDKWRFWPSFSFSREPLSKNCGYSLDINRAFLFNIEIFVAALLMIHLGSPIRLESGCRELWDVTKSTSLLTVGQAPVCCVDGWMDGWMMNGWRLANSNLWSTCPLVELLLILLPRLSSALFSSARSSKVSSPPSHRPCLIFLLLKCMEREAKRERERPREGGLGKRGHLPTWGRVIISGCCIRWWVEEGHQGCGDLDDQEPEVCFYSVSIGCRIDTSSSVFLIATKHLKFKSRCTLQVQKKRERFSRLKC